MNWIKTDLQFDNNGNIKGWTTKATWEIEVQTPRKSSGSRYSSASPGRWSIETQAAYDKDDATKIKFIVPLNQRKKRTLAYTRRSVMAQRHSRMAPSAVTLIRGMGDCGLRMCGLLLASAVVALLFCCSSQRGRPHQRRYLARSRSVQLTSTTPSI